MPTAVGLLHLPPRDDFNVSVLVWLLIGVRLLADRWQPRRHGRLVWRARVAGLDTVESGLVARRSLAGWIGLVGGAVVTVAIGAGLLGTLPPASLWARVARLVLVVGVSTGVGWAVYRQVRFTGRLALTAEGIRYGRQVYAWPNVDRVSLRRLRGRTDGVRLRLLVRPSPQPAPVIGGRDTAVPEERLFAAIEDYRTRPQALAVGLPVIAPEPAADAPCPSVRKGPFLYTRR